MSTVSGCHGLSNNARKRNSNLVSRSTTSTFVALGICSFNMYGVIKYNYSGEIDNDGTATGFGIAVNDDDPSYKFIGTFLDNLPHGLRKCQLGLF